MRVGSTAPLAAKTTSPEGKPDLFMLESVIYILHTTYNYYSTSIFLNLIFTNNIILLKSNDQGRYIGWDVKVLKSSTCC